MVPLILNFDTRWGEWLTSQPGRFTPEKKPQHTLNGRLGGLHIWSGSFGKEKTLLPLPGIEPRTVHQEFLL